MKVLISLHEDVNKMLKQQAERNYMTVSGYITYLICKNNNTVQLQSNDKEVSI